MSSTTQQPSVASSSPVPPSSSPNSNASSLLFGFLVSALSLFAVFMTSAIVWNRLIARRHAIEAMLAASPPELPRLRRPRMWDIWIIPHKQQQPWPDIKPVAAQQYGCPPNSSLATQKEQTTSFWRRHVLDRLPPEIAYVFYRPVPPIQCPSDDTNLSQVKLSHGSAIQVSLLIAMPHAPRERMHENYEMVFATTNVLYHDSVS